MNTESKNELVQYRTKMKTQKLKVAHAYTAIFQVEKKMAQTEIKNVKNLFISSHFFLTASEISKRFLRKIIEG